LPDLIQEVPDFTVDVVGQRPGQIQLILTV